MNPTPNRLTGKIRSAVGLVSGMHIGKNLIIGTSPRIAQKVTEELLAQQLITSVSPKGPLRLGSPADAAGHYFTNL
jgi:hypothetical protein